MYVSLNNARMRGLPHSHHRLGLFTDKKDTPSLPTPTSTSTPTSTILPTSFTSSSHYSMQAPYGFPISTPSYSSQRSIKRPSSMSSPINLCTSLQQHALFKNPEGITIMQHAYHIHEHGSLLAKHGVDGQSTYKNLRHQQNQAWAKESVVKGISLAKKGQYENALKCYKHALDIEPQFTQAYVARGAAYVLQGDLERAIIEFETALHIDPQQQYALTYLQAAREKLSRKMTNHSPTTIQPIPHTSPHHETSSSSSSSSPCHDDTETILLQQERNRGKEIERLMKKQKREREGGNEKKSKKKDKKRKSRKKEKKKEKKKEDRSRKRKYDTNTEDEHHEDEKEERHSRRRSRHSDREHRHKHSHSSSPQLPAVHSLPSLPPDMAFPSTALPMPHYATRHSPSHDLPSPTALPTSDANVVMEDESPIRTTIVPPADLPLTVPAPAISKHVVPSPQLVTQDDRIHAITSIQNLYDELRAEARHITRTVHHRGEPPTFEKTNHDDEDMDGVQDVIATLPTAPVNENGTKTVLPMPQSS